MMKNFTKKIYVLLFVIVFGINSETNGQSSVINNFKTAIKAGSSKELVKYFNNTVELKIEGERSSFSSSQAEFVLKDFFRKYPPVDFQYIHQGASGGGLKYAIGKYRYKNGMFRVYVLFKQFGGEYRVDTMDISKE